MNWPRQSDRLDDLMTKLENALFESDVEWDWLDKIGYLERVEDEPRGNRANPYKVMYNVFGVVHKAVEAGADVWVIQAQGWQWDFMLVAGTEEEIAARIELELTRLA